MSSFVRRARAPELICFVEMAIFLGETIVFALVSQKAAARVLKADERASSAQFYALIFKERFPKFRA